MFDSMSELLDLTLQVSNAWIGLQTPVFSANQQPLCCKSLMSFKKASAVVANENDSH